MEEVILRTNLDKGMNVRVRSQISTGNQKVSLLLIGHNCITKIFNSSHAPMKHVSHEGSENLCRRREALSRALANSRGRERFTREVKGLPKWARSRKSKVPFTWAFLLNAQEARRWAVTGVTFMQRACAGKGVSSGIMCLTTLGADNY